MKEKRLVASLVDFYICMMFNIPMIFIYIFGNPSNTIFDLLTCLPVLLILLKDLTYHNYSIGKKSFGLEVLTLNDEKPSAMKLVLRNIFIIIWPIELIMILIFGRRLGDIIFGTKVVEKTK